MNCLSVTPPPFSSLPLYGFLLFSLFVVFLLQECPISFIPGVVQVLSDQTVVGSQPVLLNILEKTESFLLFGAHHSSSFSTAFWWRQKGNVSDDGLPLRGAQKIALSIKWTTRASYTSRDWMQNEKKCGWSAIICSTFIFQGQGGNRWREIASAS